jgi:hypothetical protein
VTTSLLDGAAHWGGDGVVVVFLNAITVEAVVLPPLLFTAVLLLCLGVAGGPLMVSEVRVCARPGRGRHRRILRGRHAARGGR